MLRLAHFVVTAAFCAWTVVAGAQPADNASPRPGSMDDHGFPATVAREIYRIIPGNNTSFVLVEGEASNPVFPGKEINEYEQVECEKTSGYKMRGFANTQGEIGVAVCADGQRVQDIAMQMPHRLETLFKDSKGPREDLRTLGWYYASAKLDERHVFHYFPVIFIGHGVLTAYTGVVFDKITKRAVVVQISPYPMCESMRSLYKEAPLCTDRERTLEKMAGGIAARFVSGNQ